MTPAEAAALLTVCASFDNRKPDENTATAWAMALDGYRYNDCRDAVVAHYRVSREWIMPADVLAAVKRVRGGRIEDVAPTPPADMDPDDTAAYAEWLATVRRDIADGLEPAPEPYPATRQIGELRRVLRAVPPIIALPAGKTAEHQAGMAAVKAELAARGAAPIPGDTLTAADMTAPPLQEPMDEAASVAEQEMAE